MVTRHGAERAGATGGLAAAAADDPGKDAEVFAEAGPVKLAIAVLAEPIDVKNARLFRAEFFAHFKPVAEVIAHVVAAKGQHSHGVTAEGADFSFGCGGLFGGEGGADECAVIPIAGLEDKRDVVHAASAENDGLDRHTVRVFPFRVDAWAVARRGGEARVGMGGNFAAARRPVFTQPTDQMSGWLFGHALPPDVTVVGQGHVGKDAVLAAGFHGIGVGAVGGAGGNAEPAGFGIDRARGSVRTGLDPGNVIAHCGDFVAFEPGGGDEHGKIGFAAGAGKGGGDVAFFSVRRFQSENEHVFGHPSLIASDNRSDAQGETLFAEQGIAAVAAAVAHDEAFLGEMGDEGVLRIAGPRDVLRGCAQRATHRVEAFHVEAIRAEHVEHALSDAGHDAHVGHNVGRVGDFHPDARDL